MLNETHLRTLLRTQLLSASAFAPTLWAWENERFVPPTQAQGVVWGTERLQVQSESRAMTGNEVITGRAIYRVYTYLDGGIEVIETALSAIKNVFPPGIWLCNEPDGWTPVQIIRSERYAGARDEFDPSWYYRPIVVTWRTHAPTQY